jgi:thiamine pyrophosphokinase
MKRCVIVGGADINNYEYIKSCLRNDDFILFCDSGLKHLESLQVNPGLIVGDFDSHDNPHLGVETIVLPCEKDDTDKRGDWDGKAADGYKEANRTAGKEDHGSY